MNRVWHGRRLNDERARLERRSAVASGVAAPEGVEVVAVGEGDDGLVLGVEGVGEEALEAAAGDEASGFEGLAALKLRKGLEKR